MNQNLDHASQGRLSSKHLSIKHSLSCESSSAGNSSLHSFSVPFDLPVGVDFQERNTEIPCQQAKEVSLRRLAYLNKPEVPQFIVGSVFAIINGVVFPISGIALSSVINTYYEPPAKLRKDSKFWALFFAVPGMVSFLALPVRTYFFGVAGSKLIRRIRLMTF